MIDNLNNALNQPYPVSLGIKRDLWTIVIVDLIAAGFILVLKPFGLSNISHMDSNVFILAVAFSCLLLALFNKLALPQLLPKMFFEDRWTTGKEVLYSLYNLLSITLIILLVALIFAVARFSFLTLMQYCFYTILVGILPLTAKVLLTQIWLLKSQLQRLQNIHPKASTKNNSSAIIKLKSEGVEASQSIPVDELILLQAQQNYVRVVCLKQGKMIQQLLRISLKGIESQLNSDLLIRCHRSNIVNVSHVKKITGNAQGYQLRLHSELELIPVSRSYAEKVLNKIKQIG